MTTIYRSNIKGKIQNGNTFFYILKKEVENTLVVFNQCSKKNLKKIRGNNNCDKSVIRQ